MTVYQPSCSLFVLGFLVPCMWIIHLGSKLFRKRTACCSKFVQCLAHRAPFLIIITSLMLSFSGLLDACFVCLYFSNKSLWLKLQPPLNIHWTARMVKQSFVFYIEALYKISAVDQLLPNVTLWFLAVESTPTQNDMLTLRKTSPHPFFLIKRRYCLHRLNYNQFWWHCKAGSRVLRGARQRPNQVPHTHRTEHHLQHWHTHTLIRAHT